MIDYIPTTEEIRKDYTLHLVNDGGDYSDSYFDPEKGLFFDRWLEKHNKTKEREVLERTATKIEQFGKSWVGAEGLGLILESGKMSELFARIIREMK